MSAPTIPLTQGLVAVVDEEDYERVVAAGKWHASVRKNTAYAARSMRISGEVPYVYLHTFLTGWPLVDHRNGDGLDNRRANLREATNVENARNVRINSLNTSGFKGVFRNQAGSWVAQITAPDRRLSLGSFTTAEEAALVYDAAARELYGEFARLNFPDVDPGPMRPLPVAQQARTHCPVGHPYDATNTYWYGNSRKCRACRNEACRRYTARKRAVA